MPNRRHFIAGPAATGLARPSLVRAAAASTLRFIPVFLEPQARLSPCEAGPIAWRAGR